MRYSISIRWWIPALWALVVLVAMGGMIGCTERTVAPTDETQVVTMLGSTGLTATVEEGETGKGAKYALYCPENWNGNLVLYAHGFIDVASPIVLPTNDDWEAIRDRLVELGYGVAYSSFSANGFAVKEGMQYTHQVRGRFVSKYGVPENTYLMGHSLGGAIAIALAEKYPKQYAGALTLSGMIGGSQAQIDYVANVRMLFDFCYPGVLPGTVVDIPDSIDLYNDIILPIAWTIQTNPDCALAISQLDQIPIPFSNGEELVTSFATAIGFNIRGFDDVESRTHGHTPVDNAETVYTGPLPQSFLDAVNAGVQRYDRTPDADAYLSHYFTPTGDLSVPVITLHNPLDPSVPIFHEDIYEGLVAAAGKSSFFTRRTVAPPLYGHCKFGNSTEEGVTTVVGAFLDLVTWVSAGVQPAS